MCMGIQLEKIPSSLDLSTLFFNHNILNVECLQKYFQTLQIFLDIIHVNLDYPPLNRKLVEDILTVMISSGHIHSKHLCMAFLTSIKEMMFHLLKQAWRSLGKI